MRPGRQPTFNCSAGAARDANPYAPKHGGLRTNGGFPANQFVTFLDNVPVRAALVVSAVTHMYGGCYLEHSRPWLEMPRNHCRILRQRSKHKHRCSRRVARSQRGTQQRHASGARAL